jgi:hypothetical protein
VGNLQDADRTMSAAVALTLDALKVAPEDAAAKRLAQRYAAAIDAAERAQWLAEKALDEIPADDVMGRAYIQTLAAKVEVKELLDRLGPKLLAALEALGATPQARARLRGAQPADAKPNRLGQLRQAHGA